MTTLLEVDDLHVAFGRRRVQAVTGVSFDLGAGERGVVVRVSDDDAPRLRYLGELGLVPGTALSVAERAPFGGPIRLALALGGERLIGPALASAVLVERLD